MSATETFIGIDVSKRMSEVAVHESNYRFRCANQESDFGKLIAELIALQPKLIVLEATGGFGNTGHRCFARGELNIGKTHHGDVEYTEAALRS